jgi:hypothetical protein
MGKRMKKATPEWFLRRAETHRVAQERIAERLAKEAQMEREEAERESS